MNLVARPKAITILMEVHRRDGGIEHYQAHWHRCCLREQIWRLYLRILGILAR